MFRILGGLEITGSPVTASRDRVILARLLLGANQTVGTGELIEAVWDQQPPRTVRAQLQTCVSRLRQALPPGMISTVPLGYRIDVAAGDLDAARFTDLLREARSRETPEDALPLYREAVGLWRGPALAGTDSPAVRRLAALLDEQYVATMEERIDLEMSADGGMDVIAELFGLIDRFPLRERFRAQVMRALCRVGRPADALAEYRRLRRTLHDELGIEPSSELQDLHRRILDGGVPAPEANSGARATVRTLPRPVGDFTGRAGVVAAFRAELAAAGPRPVVQLIDGMAGVGKTTLAVHLAGLAADRYPDAHLFIDLHGHSDHDTVDPSAALLTLLRQLDVAPERIPAAIAHRVALWRSELARRRSVLVLDNAATSAQVLPLLPGSGDNLTLVTSRRRLSGLDGVRPASLPVLDADEAVDLFRRIVGDRARADPRAAADVVRRCGYLPLAIRLAAARLASRPSWRMTDLSARLSDVALPQLVAEDRTVAAAFALSYAHLPAESRRVFRLLGIHPAERLDAACAAALADITLAEAERILESLVDVHLVEATEPGSYRLHDLIRQYAGTLLADDRAETRAAADRLFDHYVHSAAVVSSPLEATMSLRNRRFGQPLRGDLLPEAGAEPTGWFDNRRRAHMATLRLAEELGADRYVWLLARSAWKLWFLRAEYDDLIDAHQRGLIAARSAGDDFAAAQMLNYLGSGLYRVGRLHEAAEVTAAAYAAFVRHGDLQTAIPVLTNLALLRLRCGDLEGAAEAAAETLDRAARLGAPILTTSPMAVMAEIERLRGDLEGSLRWHRYELQTAGAFGNAVARYLALNNVAVARMRLGHPAAERLLRLSIVLNGRLGSQTALTESTTALAVLERRTGRLDDAIRRHRSAVDLARANPDFRLRSAVCNDYAETLHAAGDRPAAAALFREAGDLAGTAGALWEEVRSRYGLAAVLDDDDLSAAGRHRERAEALLLQTRLGARLEPRVVTGLGVRA